MAQGDVHMFDQAIFDTFEAKHNFETGAYFLGIVTNATVPAVTSADPRWGAGGTVNFKATEVTPGGNYAADGKTLANPTLTLNAGVIEIDMDDAAVWSQNGSNPTDAQWGIVYNNQAAKEAVAYVDLGGIFDMQTGDLTVAWGAPMMTANQA